MSASDIENNGEQNVNNLRQKWTMFYMLVNLWTVFCFAATSTIIRQAVTEPVLIYWYLLLVLLFLSFGLEANAVLFIFGCRFIWKRRIKWKPTVTEIASILGVNTLLSFLIVTGLLVVGMFAFDVPQLLWILGILVGITVFSQALIILSSRNPRRIVAGYRFSEIGDNPPVSPLRKFAAAHGVSNPRFTLLELPAGCNEAVNIYKPTANGPMFCFSQPVLDILTAEELKAAFAHELAHHKLRHVGKTKAMKFAETILLPIGLFFVIYQMFPRITSDWPIAHAVQALKVAPYFILAGLVLIYLSRPIAMFLSRRQETRANAWALEATGDPAAFISAMKKLATHNHITGRPSLLQKALFATHPPLDDVIRQAMDYAASHNVLLDETSQGNFC